MHPAGLYRIPLQGLFSARIADSSKVFCSPRCVNGILRAIAAARWRPGYDRVP